MSNDKGGLIRQWAPGHRASVKKAQQRLHFLRVLSGNNLEKKLLVAFYRAAIESVLTYNITVWYAGCSAVDKKALQRVVRTAQRIIGCSLPSLEDIATSCYLSRATKIIRDPSHPGHHLFQLLPSGRRYRTAKVMNDRVGPVYVINLLISDLIQFCGMIFEMAQPKDRTVIDTFTYIYVYCLVASVCFMVCIALERYLVIACPLWYRFRRTIKVSVVVCVVVWIIPLVYFLPFFFWINFRVKRVIFAILLLLPLPLFIFFLGGTLKVLSASISVHSDEKRRIVGMLVLVLLIYMLLFLPSISWSLVAGAKFNKTFSNVSLTFLKLSPLADLFLYVFMKKGTVDKLLASVCCCKMDSDDISSSNSSSFIQV
uniref:mas-related G-protein coupled receptor member A4-like n=1 Tax=Epinephelus lanceolatus TaxID=310571 RepID=UPI0014461471|nr:mas-related G-protein coupled receptor member A4-like [Epinephelus lanceolatus]